MTAEELKQIFGRAVSCNPGSSGDPAAGWEARTGLLDGREYLVGREGLLEPDADLSLRSWQTQC